MARKSKQLTTEQETLLKELARKGRSAVEISEALGGVISPATAGRRARAVLGGRRTRKGPQPPRPRGPRATARERRSVPEPKPAPVPTAPTEGEELDLPGLVRELGEAAEAARVDKNYSMYGTLTRLQLVAHQQHVKMQPPPPPDPNERPDFIEAAKRGREKLHDLLDRAIERKGAA